MSDEHPLIDTFGRQVTYLRLSVTDRCDFRCLYCMAEDMSFLPRSHILSLEELATIGRTFVGLGVTKIRITGGEPLIRRNVLQLFETLGKLDQLEQLCLTTNASRLAEFARPLADTGVSRINISLDSLQPKRFRELTRFGNLAEVLKGIDAAQNAGFQRVKLNTVIMNNYNSDEVLPLTEFALQRGLDISFIEEMPLGKISSHSRDLEFISSAALRERISSRFTLTPSTDSTGGPARYWTVAGYPSRIGFISPHSENFCGSCNRVRVSAEGQLLLCLGNEHSVDLRRVLRDQPNSRQALIAAIQQGLTLKPERHFFDFNEDPKILRFMNATGG